MFVVCCMFVWLLLLVVLFGCLLFVACWLICVCGCALVVSGWLLFLFVFVGMCMFACRLLRLMCCLLVWRGVL